MVTLGIIGVVSAMTVPSLMQNYQRQSYVTQLHKVYNELSQAALRYQNDKNAVDLSEAGLNSQEQVYSFIRSYFKVVKECDKLSGCFADSYKKISGVSARIGNTKSFVISSGASLRPNYEPSNGSLISFAVDINGLKGPNVAGRDLFIVCLYNNGLVDDAPYNVADDDSIVPFAGAPLTKEERESLFSSHCSSSTSGISGCFGKILNDNWEMSY